MCFSSLVDVDLIADVQGYAPSLTGVSSTVPVRVLDTRSGVGAITHRVKPGETVELRIVGAAQSPVPPTAIAAVLNVTVDRASGPGFITVWPCGQPRPLASNLNYNAGSTVPNLVLAGLGVASSTCLFSSNEVDLVADVDGYVDGDAPFEARPPVRLLDTRVGTGAPHQPLAAGGVLELAVPVQLLADPVGGAVVLNVTVDQTTAPGYVTVWPCGQPRPLASNLNYGTASTVPNLVISGTGTDHKVCFYSSQSVELIADLDGAFAAPESLTGRLAPA